MMSKEEWERKMEFLANQRAKSDAIRKETMARIADSLDRANKNISQLAALLHVDLALAQKSTASPAKRKMDL